MSGGAGPPNSRRYRSASHTISVQLVSTLASRCKCLPNRSCPDYLVISRLSRHTPLFNKKEAPTCKRRGRCVVAFLASLHTVQHPPQEIRRLRDDAIGGLGCVDRPIEAEARCDCPQSLCESVHALCCQAGGSIPSCRSCDKVSGEQVGFV